MQEGGGERITSVPKPLVRSWEFIVLDVPSPVCPLLSPALFVLAQRRALLDASWPHHWAAPCPTSSGWGDIKPP